MRLIILWQPVSARGRACFPYHVVMAFMYHEHYMSAISQQNRTGWEFTNMNQLYNLVNPF
jgi:hypothetical protein